MKIGQSGFFSRHSITAAVLVAGGALFCGCATNNTVPVNYAPSSVMTASGAVTVGSFNYLPHEGGAPVAPDAKKKSKPKIVAANQIRNTAMGNIFIDRDVKVFVRDAIFAEIRFVGIKTESPRLTLAGSIEEFLIDDLGYSVDWTLRINYKLTDSTSNQVVYQSVKNIQRNTAKFANVFGALNETIKLNVEELLKDPAFASAIR